MDDENEAEEELELRATVGRFRVPSGDEEQC
jgi:hypothetical protein